MVNKPRFDCGTVIPWPYNGCTMVVPWYNHNGGAMVERRLIYNAITTVEHGWTINEPRFDDRIRGGTLILVNSDRSPEVHET